MKIKVKCPCCGAVLAIMKQENIENKAVTCPICKERSPLAQFKVVGEPMPNPAPQPRPMPPQPDPLSGCPGILVRIDETAEDIVLKVGKNVIGRKVSSETKADFMISTPGKNRLSREHLVIEVKQAGNNGPVHNSSAATTICTQVSPAGNNGFVHNVSLYKEKVNDTYVGTVKLEYGDCLRLEEGDIIKLPDATLKFVLKK